MSDFKLVVRGLGLNPNKNKSLIWVGQKVQVNLQNSTRGGEPTAESPGSAETSTVGP